MAIAITTNARSGAIYRRDGSALRDPAGRVHMSDQYANCEEGAQRAAHLRRLFRRRALAAEDDFTGDDGGHGSAAEGAAVER